MIMLAYLPVLVVNLTYISCTGRDRTYTTISGTTDHKLFDEDRGTSKLARLRHSSPGRARRDGHLSGSRSATNVFEHRHVASLHAACARAHAVVTLD